MKITTDVYGNFKLEEVFNPVTFVAESGEDISVVMRDSGFEVWYKGNVDDTSYQIFEFKNGTMRKFNIVK